MPGVLVDTLTVDLTAERTDAQQTQYTKSAAGSTYHFNPGLRYVPVIGPEGTPPVVVRVFAGYTSREAAFDYTKATAPPLIPSPGNTRSGHIFLGGSLTIPSPGTSGDGEMIFAASGTYAYVCPLDLRTNGKIQFDAFPFITGVDLLGHVPENTETSDEDFGYYQRAWTSPFFDLTKLTTTRILG